MACHVVLLSQPLVDFNSLVKICSQGIGHNPMAAIDASSIERSNSEKLTSCLAALEDKSASVGLHTKFLGHSFHTVLIAADERDTVDVLNLCIGMSSNSFDTVTRGLMLSFISGTLAQWRDAVKAGTSSNLERTVREVFCQAMQAFKSQKIDVWKDCQVRDLQDGTLSLEDKRR